MIDSWASLFIWFKVLFHICGSLFPLFSKSAHFINSHQHYHSTTIFFYFMLDLSSIYKSLTNLSKLSNKFRRISLTDLLEQLHIDEEISVNQYLRHNLGYTKYKLFNVTKFILVLPTFRLIQQSFSRTRCWMFQFFSWVKLPLCVFPFRQKWSPVNCQEGSGVCIYYKNLLLLKLIYISFLQECLTIELNIKNKLSLLFTFYLSPSQSHYEFSSFIINLESTL